MDRRGAGRPPVPGGRVFLAGDAAHQMTPMGTFGMNTGIRDAHNLALKLAAVLRGWAGPSLLGTYAAERRPAAVMTVEQSGKLWEGGGPDQARPGARAPHVSFHVPLQAFAIGRSMDLADSTAAWHETSGVSEAGAVLVRPEGHVAWRQPDHADAPEEVLLRVLQLLLAVGK